MAFVHHLLLGLKYRTDITRKSFPPHFAPSFTVPCYPVTPLRDSTVDATFFLAVVTIVSIRAGCNKNSANIHRIPLTCWRRKEMKFEIPKL